MRGGMASRIALQRIRPERNERRFYRMEVMTDLFGTVLLLRRWGRIGTDGRQRDEPFMDETAAVAALDLWAARKLRRGYRKIGPN